jgi:signal transduction histidine kinase
MASEGLQAYVEQQQLLLTVTRQIAGSAGLGEIIPHILDGIVRAIPLDGARLLVAGGEGRWRAYATGSQAERMAEADARILEAVTHQGEIEVSRDDPGVRNLGLLSPELDALLAIPLVAHETQHGVLWLGFRSPRLFDDAERAFLSILAGQAAIAIANARSFESARRGREWLAAILASTPDPVLVVDHDLRLQLVNPAAQEMFPSLTRGAVGQALDQIEQTAVLVDLLREYGSPDVAPQTIMEFTAENGRVYSPSISDVRAEGGAMTGWVLLLRDISHFKRLNDNMSDFLSTVSHDMRSPLTFMKGYVDMLGMVGDLNEKQNDFVTKIAVGVVQMSDMVEKILEAGKLDPMTGTYQLSREMCDAVEIVEKAMTGLAQPAAEKSLALRHSVGDGIPVLNVDRAMLTSAYTNLIENAVKYTPEGGQVDVALVVKDGDLLFSVADNGYGISPENQTRLFERNVRVHRKEWKRVKGSGLGLFIVKNVAQRHGGDAWVESAEGEGSTFYLAIPLEGPNLVGGGDAGASD